MPLNIESVTIPYSEVGRVEALESDLEAKQALIVEKDQSLASLRHERETLTQTVKSVQDELAVERDALGKLAARVIELQKNPPVIMPVMRKPSITKTELLNVAGVTLANDLVSPGDAQYDRMRLNLMLISGMGFNVGRWFMGKGEVKAINALPETNIAHLPGFAKSLNITYGADTVDRVVWDTLKIEDDPRVDAKTKAVAKAELEAYLKGLEKLATFFFVNDANQYRNTALYANNTLERIVQRIREITPNVPLLASLTANALPADYAMFDHIEAQTFGTVAEFKIFLGRKFDVFCIDGRKSVTKAYLEQIKPLFLAANPPAYFFYPTTVSDWLAMPAQMTVIRDIVAKWWALKR